MLKEVQPRAQKIAEQWRSISKNMKSKKSKKQQKELRRLENSMIVQREENAR